MGGNDYYDDGTGFFNYQDEIDWSEGAIYPQSCYSTDDGSFVVYSLYNAGHNQCKRKKMGTYETSITTFLKAYATQQTNEADITGVKYEAEDVLEYLVCQAMEVNDVYFYYKLGCRESTGKGFQVHTYTDPYCTERSTVYNNYVDTSTLQVSFDYCKRCEYQSYNKGYNGYNNGNYYNNNNNNNNNNIYQHSSPLCSAMYNYKESCGYKCRKNSKKTNSGTSGPGFFSNFGSTDYDGYNVIEIVMLWVLSISGIFFLMKGISYRKKFSKRVQMEEHMAVESAGLGEESITRAIIFSFIFITMMVVFRRKLIIWFSLGIMNILFIWYYMNLKRQSAELTQTQDGDNFELYEDTDGSVSTTKRKIYVS